MNKALKVLINARVILLAVLGISLYAGIVFLHISLWWILLAGVLSGVIFGKVFCRWVCPMGLIMEIILNLSPNSKIQGMYQYHKVGCPIAWISGWLNKMSFFKIKLNTNTCLTCGLCDKQCYIVSVEPTKYSLYVPNKQNPAISYTCSKCLKCVAVCPNGSLKFKS